MTLKTKVISGLSWNFIGNVSNYFLTFLIGIVLARLLTPDEFGLIAMVTVFTAISQTFIDSGFSGALIRKKDCTQADYSTVFYYNLIIGISLFLILFLSANAIARFYNKPELINITKVMAINFIINSFGQTQRTILIKKIDFKLKTKISVVASIVSGIIGILMAFTGWGVWSLVFRTLSSNILNIVMLWIWNKWLPSMIFSKKSFVELFSFGFKFFISGLINTIYLNVYLLIIGKFFSASDLGYYTRADKFKSLPSSNITGIVSQVSFPALAEIQDDQKKLKEVYKKIIMSTMYLSFTLMMGMAAVSEPMIITLVGEKWAPSIKYLQLLCISGMFYPVHSLNLNMLAVKGKAGLILRLEIIKKIIVIPVILIGIKFGIVPMLYGMIVNTLIAYWLNSFWSGKYINYSMYMQIRDILPSFFVAFIMSFMVYFIGKIIPYTYLTTLIVQILFGAFLVFGLSEIFKLESYMYIKKTVLIKIKSMVNGTK